MSSRFLSFALLFASALLSFAAEHAEYSHSETLVIILSAASILAVIALAITAGKYIRSGFAFDQVLLAIGVAIFPYFVSDALGRLGTPLNAHGIGLFGFALYGGLSQLAALVMIILMAVRGLRR